MKDEPSTIVAGGALFLESLSEAQRAQLLSASSEWIVNRSPHQAAVPRVDAKHTSPPRSHLVRAEANAKRQLNDSLSSIRHSIQKLEAKIRQTVPRRVETNPAPIAPPVQAPSVFVPSIQAKNFQPVAPKAQPAPSIPKSIAASADRIRAKGGDQSDPEGMNRPRVWRRWVRLDQQLEARALQWRAKGLRYGVQVAFHYEAPSGQEAWTDIDAVLHIFDHLIGSSMKNSLRGDTVEIIVRNHTEDPEWIQIAIRNKTISKPKNAPSTGDANDTKDHAIATKFASMLGGYIDQTSTVDSGRCWKLHLPADHLLSWLNRSNEAEHKHVLELEIVDLTNSDRVESLEKLVDRAVQATIGIRHKIIMIAPRRYLIACLDDHADTSALRHRFRLQLDRIGGTSFPTASIRFDLRIQSIGLLAPILKKINQRLAENHVDAKGASKLSIGATASKPIGSNQAPTGIDTNPAKRISESSIRIFHNAHGGQKTSKDAPAKNAKLA